MFVFTTTKAQNTFTATSIKADTASISIVKSDTVTGGTVRATDTLCSAKDLCVHQDAKISGDVTVTGKVVAKSGILLDTNSVGIYKMYMKLPTTDSTQGTTSKLSPFIYAGPIVQSPTVNPPPSPNPNPVGPTDPGNSNPPMDFDPCENGQLIYPWQEGSGGFIAAGTRSNVVDATLGMYIDWWTDNGMIDLMGKGLYGSNHGLYINYACGKNVYIGTGSGSGGDWKGKAGSKIYMGDFVNMRKHVEIGDPVWGTGDANNVNLESHCNGGIANIRAKTWTTNTPQFCVINTNTNTAYPGSLYQGRYTFKVFGDGRTWIRSLNNYEPLLSIGQYNQYYPSGVETFKVFADGRTYIGQKYVFKPPHTDAILQVSGKIACMELVVLDPDHHWKLWPDYVFEKGYKKDDIETVEEYINKYKHLKGIPTALEIKENGMIISQMVPKLLEKIEEQMLYIIELNSKIKALEKKIQKLEEK